MNKEAGGAILAFAGFVFIVGAFKGTWRNTIDALLGKSPSTSSTSTGAAPGTRSSNSGFPGSPPGLTGPVGQNPFQGAVH